MLKSQVMFKKNPQKYWKDIHQNIQKKILNIKCEQKPQLFLLGILPENINEKKITIY